MPLAEDYINEPEKFSGKTIDQIIRFAGNGKLLDGNETTSEFRDFLRVIEVDLIKEYTQYCLTEKFDDCGLALQDLVNEVGSRLGFEVEYGRYRNCPYDGLWSSPEGRVIVVESKKTSDFATDLAKIEEARKTLIEEGKATNENSSGLSVVGVGKTNFLEAQIRGSRFAWEMRLISVEALLKLLVLKLAFGEPSSAVRVRKILSPEEFTKLDPIIELLEGGVRDVVEVEIESPIEDEGASEGEKKPRRKRISQSVSQNGAKRISAHLSINAVKDSRTTYICQNSNTAFTIMSSNPHEEGTIRERYWYGFREHHYSFLEQFEHAYAAFACGDENLLFLIPFQDFAPMTTEMGMTNFAEDDDRPDYWHVTITQLDGSYVVKRKASAPTIDIAQYLI